MEPTDVAVGARELIDLSLLSHPENAERHQAQQPGDDARRQRNEASPEFRLGMDIGFLGDVNLKHQHRHRKRENAIAQRRDAAGVPGGQTIVVSFHARSFAAKASAVNLAGAIWLAIAPAIRRWRWRTGRF